MSNQGSSEWEEIYKKWWRKNRSCGQKNCKGCDFDYDLDRETDYEELIQPLLKAERERVAREILAGFAKSLKEASEKTK